MHTQRMDEAEVLTVLVVAPEESVRALVTWLLSKAGYQVLESESAFAALAVLEQRNFSGIDLLLTDAQLPGMDGVTLAEACIRQNSSIGVALMSRYFREKDTEAQELQYPAYEFTCLPKPFDPDAFLATIGHVIHSHKRSQLVDSPPQG